ncbi:DUF2782 domain-containing protein [Methyloprofundus sedimenti]|uniref:DUF2782 domain-containing protein n=1 Tax=Methyloprofundus sedimenti TaxID=1420851 RepID=UPI0009B60A00|nr:DUF2782 domain-containing protein [Methyloprofundus sedimenti]
MLRYLLLCLFVCSTAVIAEEGEPAVTNSPDAGEITDPSDTAEIENSPEVPDMPLPVQDGEPMEADITITRRGEKTIHEYRVNGVIYKIKVIPDIGPAYYYVDPDGDGEMEEVSESDLDSLIKINQWTILSW